MKLLITFLAISIGFGSQAHAQDFLSRHTKPVTQRILSDDNGKIAEEKELICTAESCCFEEAFLCSMEQGRCICDIYRCDEGSDQKEYWIEIAGIQAQTYCMNPDLLYKLTRINKCTQNKPYCRRCVLASS